MKIFMISFCVLLVLCSVRSDNNKYKRQKDDNIDDAKKAKVDLEHKHGKVIFRDKRYNELREALNKDDEEFFSFSVESFKKSKGHKKNKKHKRHVSEASMSDKKHGKKDRHLVSPDEKDAFKMHEKDFKMEENKKGKMYKRHMQLGKIHIAAMESFDDKNLMTDDRKMKLNKLKRDLEGSSEGSCESKSNEGSHEHSKKKHGEESKNKKGGKSKEDKTMDKHNKEKDSHKMENSKESKHVHEVKHSEHEHPVKHSEHEHPVKHSEHEHPVKHSDHEHPVKHSEHEHPVKHSEHAHQHHAGKDHENKSDMKKESEPLSVEDSGEDFGHHAGKDHENKSDMKKESEPLSVEDSGEDFGHLQKQSGKPDIDNSLKREEEVKKSESPVDSTTSSNLKVTKKDVDNEIPMGDQPVTESAEDMDKVKGGKKTPKKLESSDDSESGKNSRSGVSNKLDGDEGKKSFSHSTIVNAAQIAAQCYCKWTDSKDNYTILVFNDDVDCTGFGCHYNSFFCDVERYEVDSFEVGENQHTAKTQSKIVVSCVGYPLHKEVKLETSHVGDKETVVSKLFTGEDNGNLTITIKSLAISKAAFYGKTEGWSLFEYFKTWFKQTEN